MNKAKKILTNVSIIAMALAVIIIATAIFGAPVFAKGGVLLNIMLSLATIAVASIFSVSALSFYNKNKILSLASLCLLGISTILAIVVYWSGFSMTILGKATIIISVLAILFNIIVSQVIKHGRKHLILQIVLYSLIAVLDVVITLSVLGVNLFAIPGFWQCFAVVCLAVFALFCALAIIGKKEVSDEIKKDNNEDKVVLSKDEYDKLLAQLDDLKAEVKLLRSTKNSSK